MPNAAFRDEVLDILSRARDMTLATVREDGYPQATTVSYAHDGLALYFGCAAASQKARNIALSDKVSLAIALPYAEWSEIRGLSVGGRARRLSDPREVEEAGRLLLRRFPEAVAEYFQAEREDVALFQVRPEVIAMLDYRKGFGHVEQAEIDSLAEPEPDYDPVEEADLESFPASDPPAWTRTTTR